MEEITNQVEKQQVEISYIKQKIDEIASQNQRQNDQLEKISNSIAKQELILEKISSLEDKFNMSLKGVYSLIDQEKINYDTKIQNLEERLTKRETIPCQNINIINEKIINIQKEIDKHNRIFWWLGTLIVGAIIIGILKDHLH